MVFGSKGTRKPGKEFCTAPVCVPSDVEALQYLHAFGWWELLFQNRFPKSFFPYREIESTMLLHDVS